MKLHKKFSVPYNGDPGLITYLIKNKYYLSDVYFGLLYLDLPSSRIMDYKENPHEYTSNLYTFLIELKRHKIDASLVINASCEGNETFSRNTFNKYKRIINSFLKKGLIKNVVLYNLAYYQKLKTFFPDLIFIVSVNTGINSLNKARYVSQLGLDTIVLDTSLNNNKSLIKKISRVVSSKIRLLVNEGCTYECLYRGLHFNLLSHHHSGINYKKIIPCVDIYSHSPWKILKSSFILPSEIRKYNLFVDVFKIAGRDLPSKLLKYILDSYFHEAKKGDLLSLLSSYGLYVWKSEYIKSHDHIPYFELSKLSKDFRKKVNNCNINCNKCNYCEKLWKDNLASL